MRVELKLGDKSEWVKVFDPRDTLPARLLKLASPQEEQLIVQTRGVGF
jgi:hypothetical protein